MPKPPTKGYRLTVEFIALNDEPMDLDLESIRNYISTITASVAFGKRQEKIAADVLRWRRRAIKTLEETDHA